MEIRSVMVSWRVKLGSMADFCITFSAYLFCFQLKVVRELRRMRVGKGFEIA